LFYISIKDIIQLLGQRETAELFENCFKAMLKAVSYNFPVSNDNSTAHILTVYNVLSNKIDQELNNTMFTAVKNGLNKTTYSIPAFKTYKLTEIYSVKQIKSWILESKSDIHIDTLNPYKNDSDWMERHIYFPLDEMDYSLSYHWSYNHEKMIAAPSVTAFGLNVIYHPDTLSFKRCTFFWLDWNDVIHIYSPVEVTLLKYAFYKSFIDFQDQKSRHYW
jgi:hypothetical protein